MKVQYDHIYFSPHLDDIALSCGGIISAQRSRGDDILVVTVFSGAESIPTRATRVTRVTGVFSVFAEMAERRKEDDRAMAALGVGRRLFGYAEAIQRDRRYRSLPGLFSHIAKSDTKIIEEIYAKIRDIFSQYPKAKYWFPLGVGNHVDHQILFRIAGRLAEKRTDEDIIYYEEFPYADIPYLAKHRLDSIGAPYRDASIRSVGKTAARTYHALLSIPVIRDNIERFQKPFLYALIISTMFYREKIRQSMSSASDFSRLTPEVVDVTLHIELKANAIMKYESQVRALFGDADAAIAAMRRYGEGITGRTDVFAERYWSVD